MNISSILITIVGIIIILALYVLSRASKNKLPNTEITNLPKIKDSEGNEFTSILDDIPASEETLQNDSKLQKPTVEVQKIKQIVLFISGKDEDGLDGNLIKQSLLKNKMKLGDKDIYHYFGEKDGQANKFI